jgi:hypothetical protein
MPGPKEQILNGCPTRDIRRTGHKSRILASYVYICELLSLLLVVVNGSRSLSDQSHCLQGCKMIFEKETSVFRHEFRCVPRNILSKCEAWVESWG